MLHNFYAHEARKENPEFDQLESESLNFAPNLGKWPVLLPLTMRMWGRKETTSNSHRCSSCQVSHVIRSFNLNYGCQFYYRRIEQANIDLKPSYHPRHNTHREVLTLQDEYQSSHPRRDTSRTARPQKRKVCYSNQKLHCFKGT